MSRGWWTVGRFRGAPVRLHWTVPIGALVMGRFAIVPAFWFGFVLLVLVHELGHALLVLRYRLGLSEIAVHGLGGYCQHERSGTPLEEAAVAWGGVLAQAALLAAAYAVVLVVGQPQTEHGALFFSVLSSTNLWLIAINLLPIEPLDGRKAWPLFGILFQRWQRRRKPATPLSQPRRTIADELRDLESFDAGNGRQEQPSSGETPSQRTDRLVRELIARTTQSKRER